MAGGEETPLVGLVVVSHSRALADAAVGLASEMLAGRPVRMEVAAGLDETTFGTDAVQIEQAIERADGPAGVVVLMDLGSAVLSAELALELLSDPATRERVRLSPGPIVEGLVLAAVAAAGGASREEVAAEAGAALLAKTEHLGGPADSQPQAPPGDGSGPDVVDVIEITPEHGLHARPAARLVGALSGLVADVRLTNLTTGAGPVPARSLSRVAMLAALCGHRVQVSATGPQAQLAVDRLVQLAARNFDEGPAPTAAPAPASSTGPTAGGPLPGAPGIAIGPARRLHAVAAPVDRTPAGDPDAEWARLSAARDAVRRELIAVGERTRSAAGEQEAEIFAAHAALLDDGDLLADVRRRVDHGESAAAAWSDVLVRVEAAWVALPDPYLRERAADVRAVREQMLRALDGSGSTTSSGQQLSGPGILVTDDLSPVDAAGLDLELVTGVVLAGGSPTSHAAILARARGVPLVVAAGPVVLGIPEGTRLAIDGGAGELVVAPDDATVGEFARRATVLADERAADLAAAGEPAVTRDGAAVTVAANVGSVADARAAAAAGADGSGLVRTEFLFLGRSAPPDRDEQQADYAAIAAALAGHRVTVRTLDVGGDKPLPYLPVAAETNPFLGLRGIRLRGAEPSVLADQLAAIGAAARTAPLDVMFPMVSSLSELLDARAVLADVAGPQGLPAGLRVGIMVEVPAAALKIETFLPHLDFVSIGTNDLTQYTLAAERGNASVAELSDPLDPGVLALVDRVARAAEGRIEVSVCGDAAADPVAIPVLLGLGVRSLSVSPSAVPTVKAVVRGFDLAACRDLARLALTLTDAGQVRDLVRSSR